MKIEVKNVVRFDIFLYQLVLHFVCVCVSLSSVVSMFDLESEGCGVLIPMVFLSRRQRQRRCPATKTVGKKYNSNIKFYSFWDIAKNVFFSRPFWKKARENDQMPHKFLNLCQKLSKGVIFFLMRRRWNSLHQVVVYLFNVLRYDRRSHFSAKNGQGSNPKNVQSRAEGVIIEPSERLGCHSNRHDVLYLTNVFY